MYDARKYENIADTNTRDEHAHAEPATPKPAVIHLVKALPLRTEAEAWDLAMPGNEPHPLIEKWVKEELLRRGLYPEFKASKSRSDSSADPADCFDKVTVDNITVPDKKKDREEWAWYRKECKEHAELAGHADTYTHTKDELVQGATVLAFEKARYEYDPTRSKFNTYLERYIKPTLKRKNSTQRPDALDRPGSIERSEDGDGSTAYHEKNRLEHQFAGGKKRTNASILGRRVTKRKRGDTAYYTVIDGDLTNKPDAEDAILNGQWFHVPGEPEPKFVGIEDPAPVPAVADRLPDTLDEAIGMIRHRACRPPLRMRVEGKSYEEIAQCKGYTMEWLDEQVLPLELALCKYYPNGFPP
jgi:hypothetical protein